jgi:RNA polymerase sigma-70 factor (ECF subfamily)
MTGPDSTLLTRWRVEGDGEAFLELARRHSGMVYGVCRRVLRDATEAEDVSQECFATLATHGRMPRGSVGAWLHKMATNRTLDRLKTERRRRARDSRFVETQGTTVEAAWDDLQDAVDIAIASLPGKLREPLVAHYLEGESHAGIGGRTGIPRRTISNRIAKGIDEVRKSLAKRGIPVGAATLGTIFGTHMAEAAPASMSSALSKVAMAGPSSVPTVVGGKMVVGAGAYFGQRR